MGVTEWGTDKSSPTERDLEDKRELMGLNRKDVELRMESDFQFAPFCGG